jgi:hypothetical protein
MERIEEAIGIKEAQVTFHPFFSPQAQDLSLKNQSFFILF